MQMESSCAFNRNYLYHAHLHSQPSMPCSLSIANNHNMFAFNPLPFAGLIRRASTNQAILSLVFIHSSTIKIDKG